MNNTIASGCLTTVSSSESMDAKYITWSHIGSFAGAIVIIKLIIKHLIPIGVYIFQLIFSLVAASLDYFESIFEFSNCFNNSLLIRL